MISRNPKAICATCPYWSEPKVGATHGLCRRYAPKEHQWVLKMEEDGEVVAQNEGGSTDWGPTLRNDWCGEHPEFELKA